MTECSHVGRRYPFPYCTDLAGAMATSRPSLFKATHTQETPAAGAGVGTSSVVNRVRNLARGFVRYVSGRFFCVETNDVFFAGINSLQVPTRRNKFLVPASTKHGYTQSAVVRRRGARHASPGEGGRRRWAPDEKESSLQQVIPDSSHRYARVRRTGPSCITIAFTSGSIFGPGRFACFPCGFARIQFRNAPSPFQQGPHTREQT